MESEGLGIMSSSERVGEFTLALGDVPFWVMC